MRLVNYSRRRRSRCYRVKKETFIDRWGSSLCADLLNACTVSWQSCAAVGSGEPVKRPGETKPRPFTGLEWAALWRHSLIPNFMGDALLKSFDRHSKPHVKETQKSCSTSSGPVEKKMLWFERVNRLFIKSLTGTARIQISKIFCLLASNHSFAAYTATLAFHEHESRSYAVAS